MGVSAASLAAAFLVLAAVGALGPRGRSARRRIGAATPSSRRRRAVGRLAARLPGKLVAPEDEALALAAALVVIAAALLVDLVAAVLTLGALSGALGARRRARRRERAARIERTLPEVIDLLVLVVGAGRSTSMALRDVGARAPEPFRSEMIAVVRRIDAGEPFADALHRLRDRMGSSVSSVVYAMTAAEIDGVALQPALERAADEAHRRRRVRAEEAARRVPIMMLFPLVFCILPAFCLLTVLPLVMGAVEDLRLSL